MKHESLYDEEWKLLRHIPNQILAAMAVQILEAENIPVYKLDGAIGVHLPGLGGSKVYVRGCDLDRAERILKEIESGQDKAPSSSNCLNGERDT